VLNADLQVPERKKRVRKIRIHPLENKITTLPERLREEGRLEAKMAGKVESLSEGHLQALRMAMLRALEIRHGGCPERIHEGDQ
jgi:hypothetical protein